MRADALHRVRALAVQLVDAIVEAAIASTAPAEERDSERRPPGVSRRLFNATCRSGRVHGAVKRGRTWTCSRAAWDAARTAKLAPSLDDSDLADRALRGEGVSNVVRLRPTRKAI